MILSGSYGIVLTPLNRSGCIYEDELIKSIDLLARSSVDGIVVCGSTGEFPFFSLEENKLIMKAAQVANKSRKPLVAGTTAPNADICVEYNQYAEKLGYDAVLVAPPYYFTYSDDEIYNFYKEVSEKSEIKIAAYNIPFFTGQISMDTFKRIICLKNVVAMKNSFPNMKEIAHQVEIAASERPEFSVLTGTDDIIFQSLTAGCKGNFTAMSALVPDWITEIYNCFKTNDYINGAKLQQAILPLTRVCDSLTFPLGYKLFAEVLGMKNEYYKQSLSSDALAKFSDKREELRKVYYECKSKFDEYAKHKELSGRVIESVIA